MDVVKRKMVTEKMIKHCFIVTSAINTKFGVYSPDQRLVQTLTTLKTIKTYVPDATIVIMECAGVPLTENQNLALASEANYILDYTEDQNVQDIYHSTDNWDIVKNSTEIMCFSNALAHCKNNGWLKGIDRIHKMSGRYLLTDNFDLAFYEKPEVQDRIVIGTKKKSQFPEHVTQQTWQYMARLWSWPTSRVDEIVDVYQQGLVFLAQRISEGGYIDIEHVLAKFLNQDHVCEQPVLGIEGCIAPTGTAIKE